MLGTLRSWPGDSCFYLCADLEKMTHPTFIAPDTRMGFSWMLLGEFLYGGRKAILRSKLAIQILCGRDSCGICYCRVSSFNTGFTPSKRNEDVRITIVTRPS